MKTIEYRFIDKSDWTRGAWDNEPDKVQWPDPATGLPCLAVRSPHTGSWCGYVGVTEDHKWFGIDYDEAQVDIDAHGGLTFSNFCSEHAEKEQHICHIVEPGEPDRVWWFGFDCAHADDLMPAVAAALKKYAIEGKYTFMRWDHYRDLAYIQAECARIAQQLIKKD